MVRSFLLNSWLMAKCQSDALAHPITTGDGLDLEIIEGHAVVLDAELRQ